MSEVLKVVQDSCLQAIAAVREVSARAPGTTLTHALIVGALTGFLTYRVMKKRYHLPPGPWPLPLLGNLLSMTSKEEEFYVTLDRWAREKYGPIMSVYFGPLLCVILNDLDSITEALVQKGSHFSGRPSFHSLDTLTEGSRNISLVDPTPAWKLHRKIATKALRLYMTRSHLDKVVHDTMDQMSKKMTAESGPFDPKPHIYTLIFHIIDRICFGEEKPYDDPSIQRLFELYEGVSRELGNGFYEDIVPFLKYRPTKRFRELSANWIEMLEYYEENIQKHRQRFSPGNIRDVTDSILLAQMEAAREESAEVMAMFTDVHVRQTISDLFMAGMEATANTLEWALLFLAGHPEIQKRAQAEIDEATGTGMPRVEHRDKLHYTQAVLYEVMRRGIVSPTSVPYKTMCDTSVGGYDIPKGTMVMINLWAVMFDPRLWDQPDQFKPERFLDEQGKLKPTPKAWLPFSTGRRVCLGESVAKPELLLLLACFLKRFTISLPDGVPYDPSTKLLGLLYFLPKPYKIVVTPR